MSKNPFAAGYGGAIFYERLPDTARHMVDEYRAGTKMQPWRVAPAQQIAAVWRSAAQLGFVRDADALSPIVDRFVENTARLLINTEIAGHGRLDTHDALRDLDIDDAIEDADAFVEWAIATPSGGWRISDIGLDPLVSYAACLLEDRPPMSTVSVLDAMLNVTHPRSDLASWYVEGGSRTLSMLAAA